MVLILRKDQTATERLGQTAKDKGECMFVQRKGMEWVCCDGERGGGEGEERVKRVDGDRK